MNYSDLIQKGKPVIKTQIEGNFEGFDDEKLFQLYHGQYWIQKGYKYWYHYAYMPDVTIYEYGNSYYLTVDGENEYVEVEELDNVIKAIIVNDFKGWKGDAIFELDNGQIWKQNEYDYDYNYSYRPEALIYPTRIGHKILVEGKSVGVKRIK